MISLPEELETRLDSIARRYGRTKEECAVQAILDLSRLTAPIGNLDADVRRTCGPDHDDH